MKTFEEKLRESIADDERTIRLLKIRAALLIVRLVIEVGLTIAMIVFLVWLLK
jgi:hypothetical protein